MSTKFKILCGVPQRHCMGSHVKSDQTFSTKKAHPSREEAFKCMARYLVQVEGYEQIGSREFRKDGHPVRVLTKKSKYGGKLRMGKEGRYMPDDPMTRGLIVG